jgi:hypothetical protein
MGQLLVSCDFCLSACYELVAGAKLGVMNRAVFFQLPDAPSEKSTEEGAGCRVVQDPVKIEQRNYVCTIRHFIETFAQAFEFAFGVANRFDITGVVRY